MVRAFPRLMLLLLPAIGCNVFGYQSLWVQNEYPDVRFDDALDVLVDAVDRDYDIDKIERESGVVESRWSEAAITTFERRSTRSRVHAEVLRGNGQAVLIRVRVEREVCKATSVFREHDGEDDWESYPDDMDEADRLLTQVHLVLHEFGPSPALKQRIRRAQEGLPPGSW